MAMAMESETVGHVVIAPFPTQGHLLPAIALAQALATRGRLFVSFVLSDHRLSGPRSGSAASHLHTLLALHPSSFRLIAIPDSLPSLCPGHGVDEGLESMVEEIARSNRMQQPFEHHMEDLMAAASPPGAPLCIISDSWHGWMQETADKFEIPRYVFYTCQSSVLAVLFYLPILRAQGRLPLKATPAPDDVEACDEQLVVRVPNLPPQRNLDCHGVLLEDFSAPISEDYFTAWMKVHRAKGVLIDSFYELDPVSVDALKNSDLNPNQVDIFTVGPLRSSVSFVLPASSEAPHSRKSSQDEIDCLRWLDQQPALSVLFISFGTIYLPSVAQIHELALGLEASQQNFLWVVRPPAGPLENFRVSSVLPEGFLSRTQGKGLIVLNWAPQQLVLSHPSTGAFFTHCGWNSTIESICVGIPTITFPQFGDQRVNSMLLVKQLKVGVEPHKGADGLVERGEMERVTRLVLTGKEGMKMRSRAKQYSAAAIGAVKKGGSSDHNLESFIMQMERLALKNS